MELLPAIDLRHGKAVRLEQGDARRATVYADDPLTLLDRFAAAGIARRRRDTADGDGWWDGVLAYNRSIDYARRVWTAADRYATALP